MFEVNYRWNQVYRFWVDAWLNIISFACFVALVHLLARVRCITFYVYGTCKILYYIMYIFETWTVLFINIMRLFIARRENFCLKWTKRKFRCLLVSLLLSLCQCLHIQNSDCSAPRLCVRNGKKIMENAVYACMDELS